LPDGAVPRMVGCAMTAQIDVAALAVEELRAALQGDVIDPASPDYEERRSVWNRSIDRSPAAIARCTSAADVVEAVRVGREAGLAIAVRGGGHSFPGHSTCDGGLVIDLSPMKAIQVDPEQRTATAEAGALLGELDQATQAHGLAVTAGIVTHTGLAGLTLGGGIGWLMRKHGLTIDQLLSVDLVTASGDVVRASEDENADLFWGVRGGGGNFGVVTRFEFRLNSVGPVVLAGPVFWPIAESPRLLRFYREWIADAPDELMTIVVHRKAPPLEVIPPDLHGEPIVAVVCCWCGDGEEGDRVLAPLKAFGSPVLDLCEPKQYLAHQAMFDASYPHGWWYYMRACDVAELSDEVIDTTFEHASRIQSPLTAFPIWQMGGTVARVGEDETAFSGRGAGHTFNLTAMTATEAGFDAEREWVRDFFEALAPHQQGVYVNFLMDEGKDRVRAAYGPEKYERLRALKRRYDPSNLFRLNQNVPPG
jgi:hypothetical protein